MTEICHQIEYLNKNMKKEQDKENSNDGSKIEKFVVEGTNWKVGITIDTCDFDDIDAVLIECATRGIEYSYHSNPTDFKLGAYIQITTAKKTPELRWVNSHTALINASMYKIAERLKENVMKHQKIDIEKEKRVV
jgi:hypothetical protein